MSLPFDAFLPRQREVAIEIVVDARHAPRGCVARRPRIDVADARRLVDHEHVAARHGAPERRYERMVPLGDLPGFRRREIDLEQIDPHAGVDDHPDRLAVDCPARALDFILEVRHERANLAPLCRNEKQVRVVVRLLAVVRARDKQHLRSIRRELAVFFGNRILRQLDRRGAIGGNIPQLHPVGVCREPGRPAADDDALAAGRNLVREDVVGSRRHSRLGRRRLRPSSTSAAAVFHRARRRRRAGAGARVRRRSGHRRRENKCTRRRDATRCP